MPSSHLILCRPLLLLPSSVTSNQKDRMESQERDPPRSSYYKWRLRKLVLNIPKGNQSWILIGRTDAEAETLTLWPPDVKNWLIWKDPDAAKDWRQEEKGAIEDEMVGWHHWLDGHGFGWTLGVGDGQGGLACCGSWGCKELDMTERLNWTELNWYQRNDFNEPRLLHFPIPRKALNS